MTVRAVSQLVSFGPVTAHQFGQLGGLVDHALGQDPDGLLDVGEVLVEGGRRGAGLAGRCL